MAIGTQLRPCTVREGVVAMPLANAVKPASPIRLCASVRTDSCGALQSLAPSAFAPSSPTSVLHAAPSKPAPMARDGLAQGHPRGKQEVLSAASCVLCVVFRTEL